MLDRLISGAGAVTDVADRSVRLSAAVAARTCSRAGRGRHRHRRPVRARGHPRVCRHRGHRQSHAAHADPGPVAQAEDLGSRTYATIDGSSRPYVETYTDDNANGTRRRARTARPGSTSCRPGTAVRRHGPQRPAGRPLSLRGRRRHLSRTRRPEDQPHGGGARPVALVDTTAPSTRSGRRRDPRHRSAAGTPMPRIRRRTRTTEDTNGANQSRRVDSTRDLPVFDDRRVDRPRTRPESAGHLRCDERTVSDAKTTEGSTSAPSPSATSTWTARAGERAARVRLAAALVAGVILIGLAGGYLVYRDRRPRCPNRRRRLASAIASRSG